MKCVILAAGEGIRMRPLTNDTHKSMLKIAGKPIMEHISEVLPKEINEVVLVVGYLRETIMNHFGDKFGGLKVDYVIQEEKTGTYDALKLCEDYLNEEKFLLMYADDLHGPDGLKDCVSSNMLALLVTEVSNPSKFGVIEANKDNIIINIEEKPENPKSNLVSNGVLLLDKNIFKYPAQKHSNGERYLTDSIEQMIEAGFKFKAIKSDFWLPIGFPEDLTKAETALENAKFKSLR